MRKFAAIVALLCSAFALRADERFWIAAKVNDRPVTFMFDSGSYNQLIPSGVAGQLALTNQSGLFLADECRLALGDAHCWLRFELLDVPQFVTERPQILGWPILRTNILSFNAITGRIQLLKSLPSDIASWTKIPLFSHSAVLVLQLNQPSGLILIDTGNSDGVSIDPEVWRNWHDSQRKSLVAISANFNPSAGVSVAKTAWAKDFTLGPIHLTDVPVGESGPWDMNALGTNTHLATFGKAALERLDFIVDGPNGFAYLRPKTSAPLPFDYNRSGVVFAPPAGYRGSLVAHVVKGGPAFRAGVRDGDVLLAEDGHDMTHWQTNFYHPAFAPPGQAIIFSLARGSRTFNTTVVCEQILGPPYVDPASRPHLTNDFLDADVPLRLSPPTAGNYFDLGCDLVKRQSFAPAIESLTEALRLGSTNLGVYAYRGYSYVQLQQYDAAIPDFTKFLEADPQDASSHLWRGVSYSRLRQLDKAIDDLTWGINLSPKTPDSYRERGVAYWIKLQLTSAAADFQQAILLDPHDDYSMSSLAYLEALNPDPLSRKPQDARHKAEQACKITNWKQPERIATLGMVCASVGLFDDAIKYEKMAYALGTYTASEQLNSRKRRASYENHQIYTGQ